MTLFQQVRSFTKNKSAGCVTTQSRNSVNPAIAHCTGSLSGIQNVNAGGLNVSKYRSIQTEIDGIKFASRHEASRYAELKLLEKAGLISGLQLQRVYTLIGAQKDKDGKLLERPVKYIADFVYTDSDGKTVVEDAKGIRTDVYKIKRKLMLSIYGIRIHEV